MFPLPKRPFGHDGGLHRSGGLAHPVHPSPADLDTPVEQAEERALDLGRDGTASNADALMCSAYVITCTVALSPGDELPVEPDPLRP